MQHLDSSTYEEYTCKHAANASSRNAPSPTASRPAAMGIELICQLPQIF